MKRVFFLSVSLMACSTTSSLDGQGDTGRPGDVSEPRAAPGDKAQKKPPLRAKLVGPEAPAVLAPIRLTLQIERPAAIPSDVDVEIRLPESVLLHVGERKRTLAKNAGAARDELHYELMASELPAEDAIIVLDAHGPGFGYHAELPYRFGRPEPAHKAVEAGGAEVKVGPHNFGESVPVRP